MCVSAGAHVHTVTLGMVLPFTAHLFFRSAPCLKTGWKKSEKSLGLSAVNEVDREMNHAVDTQQGRATPPQSESTMLICIRMHCH